MVNKNKVLIQKLTDALKERDPVVFEKFAVQYMNTLAKDITVAISPTRLSVLPCVVAVLEIYAEHFRKEMGTSGNKLADELKGGVNNFITITLPNNRRS